jgi:hypothetical protein
LISARGYKRYLEIGCDDDTCFSQVQIEKVGVDPMRGGTLRMFSDDFFACVGDARFDIIFIDGDHTHAQALRDVENALAVLSPGGCIVMHDCLPADEKHEAPFLCGTVWRAFVKLRTRMDLDCVVGDYDHGVGIVERGTNQAPIIVPQSMDSMTYRQFAENRAVWMRPVSFDIVQARACQ